MANDMTELRDVLVALDDEQIFRLERDLEGLSNRYHDEEDLDLWVAACGVIAISGVQEVAQERVDLREQIDLAFTGNYRQWVDQEAGKPAAPRFFFGCVCDAWDGNVQSATEAFRRIAGHRISHDQDPWIDVTLTLMGCWDRVTLTTQYFYLYEPRVDVDVALAEARRLGPILD